jgi:drug/metabolite transporter (DMT)-like permease
MRRLLAYAAVYFLWGGTFLAVRTVVLVTPPFSAAAIRFLLSGLILFALSRLERGPWPTRREWADSAKLGFIMFTVNYATFFWAEQRLYSGVAAVVAATLPVWIMLTEQAMGEGRAIRVAGLVGSALGIAGVLLVALGGGRGVPSSSHNGVAICVLLSGTVCWAIGSVWSRRLALPASQSTRSALQMTTGGAMLSVLALASGEAPAATAAVLRWTPVTWACFVYLIFASIVAFTAYVWLLHHEPANRVASYAYVNPVVALALGVGLAGEQIGRWQVLGGALVLLGVFSTLKGKAATVVSPVAEVEAA